MNTIEFQIVATPHYYGDGVQILIDGEELIELARAVELEITECLFGGVPAGRYSELPAKYYLPPSRHFWGEDAGEGWDGKSELLTCGDCGEVGCWPLVARIVAERDRIIWSEFEQPHRSEWEFGETAWRYTGLGPFIFERAEYEAALQRAVESPRQKF